MVFGDCHMGYDQSISKVLILSTICGPDQLSYINCCAWCLVLYFLFRQLKLLLLHNFIDCLGGFPNSKSTSEETRGIYKERFKGCIKEVAWSDHNRVTDFTKYKGENIRSCPLF